MEDSTIFVAIASYRDTELIPTITNLLLQARRPERVTVGICVQSNKPGDSEIIRRIGVANQIRVTWIDHNHSRGACWARSEAHRLWKGEEYVLNIDRHMRFAQNWDEVLLDMINRVPSNKALISTYPAPYYPPNNTIVATPKIVANGFFRGGIVRLRGQNCSMRSPALGAFIAGGFFFVHCNFLEEVPYDPNLYFIGEEHSLSVRAFSHGWDVFVPNQCILYHHYRDAGARRHWLESEKWLDIHAASLKRVEALLGLREFDEQLIEYRLGGRFGLGKVRSLQQFEDHSGVFPRKRRLQRKARTGHFNSCRGRIFETLTWRIDRKRRILVTGYILPRKSDRLVLRRPRIRDAQKLHRAIGESLDDLHMWLAWPKSHSVWSTMNYVMTTVSGNRVGRILVAVVEHTKFPGNIVGVATLHNFNRVERRAELGYWIRPTCRSMGIATDAAKIMVTIGFISLGLERIDSLISLENHPSVRVVEKLGFTRVAIDGDFDKSAYVRFSLSAN